MSADTILHRLHRRAETSPDAVAYSHKQGEAWVPVTWRSYAAEVRRAASALVGLGFEPGQVVCILGFNRHEWAVMDLGCMLAGGAPAGIYETSSASEAHYILQHAAAPVVLVENAAQLAKILEVRGRLPDLRHIVLMRGTDAGADPMVLTWEGFLAKGDGVDAARVDARLAGLTPDSLATLIYTSGTTGPPKGVMLSHHNLSWTANVAIELVHIGADDHTLSYLPLAHIAEQMFTLHVPISSGCQVWYAESVAKMPQNLPEVRPTVLFGVPRVWEKIYAKLGARLAEATGVKKFLVDFARGVGGRVHALKNRGEEPTGLLKIEYQVAHAVVFSKLHKALGLDRVKVMVSGAAPIAAEVLEFFATLDLPIREVYGQSEDSGPTTFNAPGRTRFGTVGPALPGVEVALAPDGEVRVRGPNVFMGYFKDPVATAQTMEDGWLCSGDLGSFDAEGFLTIVGRKKEILITAGGKNVAPVNIEAALKHIDGVGEAVVIGDRRKYLVALLTLDPEAAVRLAAELGVAPAELGTNPTLLARLQAGVEGVNREVSRVESVKRFAVLPAPFEVGDELTATMKIRRKRVVEKYAATIETLYVEG